MGNQPKEKHPLKKRVLHEAYYCYIFILTLQLSSLIMFQNRINNTIEEFRPSTALDAFFL